MLIDEAHGPEESREATRRRVDEALNRPFDPIEAMEYDQAKAIAEEAAQRETWGDQGETGEPDAWGPTYGGDA